ncbi:hypothetical protein JCM10213_005917 [Rhodosporidiobolus nylandii]
MSSFRLLDLPAELIGQIVEDAVPTAMGSRKEYSERCRTLLAVILTSKRLHAVALPLLYRVLRVTNSRFGPIMAACRGADTPTYPSVKTLVCDGEGFGGLAVDILSFAFAAAPAVSDVRLYRCDAFALVELQTLSGLTSLTLHNTISSTALRPQYRQPLCLPHVVDLSLNYFYFTKSTCTAFLSSATFPSLQHLALGRIELATGTAQSPISITEEVAPLINPALLAQLRTLRCWHASHPSDFPFPDTLQVLHNASVGLSERGQPLYASLPLSPHIALLLRGKALPNPGASRDRNRLVNAKGALEQMAASLSRVADAAKPPLKLVLLESELLAKNDVLADKKALAELKLAVDGFLAACKAAGVEVLIENAPQYGFESLISKRFIRWCNEKEWSQ